jgi:hypothetical protein
MQTPESTLEALASRVERLEKLKSEVVTEKIVLVDACGKTRATLRLTDEVPSLILYDADGNVCAILRVSAEGPALHLLGSKTKAGLELTVFKDGPAVSLFDTNGKQRLTVNVAQSDSDIPYLTMRYPNGTPAVVVSAAGMAQPCACLTRTTLMATQACRSR